MSDHPRQRRCWKQVLLYVLAIAFGICAIAFPREIIIGQPLDSLLGVSKPLSASMTAGAAPFALIALVLLDALVNLFETGRMDKRGARVRAAIGGVRLLSYGREAQP